tara:strand:+ start:26679 stop:28550 length:1872 start_codon:yes stop_codon:yes gene_type:complete
MSEIITAEFGTWDSPIGAEMVAKNNIAFQDIVLDNNNIYWSEMRPSEGGRYVIVKQSNHKTTDILPDDYNARSRVHEYGGSAFTVKDDIIYFVNYTDQKIYELKPDQKPRAITQAGTRFADMHVTPFGIIAVAESHTENKIPENYIAQIDTESGKISKITDGKDFYASIAISSDYKNIAWICWNQPNMPWDNNELWTAKLSDNGISSPQQIEPKVIEQSFFQPQWRKDNQLFVISDKSNWWNLYAVSDTIITPVFKVNSEIGLPQWVFNMSTWGFYNDKIICTFSEQGMGKLFEYDADKLSEINLPFTSFSQIRCNDNNLVMLAGSSTLPTRIIKLTPDYKHTTLQSSLDLQVHSDYLSAPEHIQFDTTDGRQAYAYFYPPKNKHYQGMAHSLPPLIVKSHGGPTASASPNLNLQIQYWTSRGFAFADVNYAGSTGYGRQYRKSLEGQWGIYDIDDCSAVAKYLSSQNKVNSNKLAITGGSAGGYTTLAALTFTNTFHVGASHYGVSNLEALAKETHKFEAKYLDRLIGPYPEAKNLYRQRAPIENTKKLSAPIIFFQGAEDEIVPPNQAEAMYFALKEKGIKTSYFLFPGEQHGFRKSENIVTALEEQNKFFVEVLISEQVK